MYFFLEWLLFSIFLIWEQDTMIHMVCTRVRAQGYFRWVQ